jgi:hypothetical protein
VPTLPVLSTKSHHHPSTAASNIFHRLPHPPPPKSTRLNAIKMVKPHLPPQAQTSSCLLLLPAEVRTKIWRLLFADSKIVYNKCAYDRDLTTERYQITQTCRFAYLDAFNLLWSNTTIKYIGCVPAPNNAGLKEQFAASVACRKLVPRLELELVHPKKAAWENRILQVSGLRYFAPLEEVLIGPFRLEHTNISTMPVLQYRNADAIGSDQLLLNIIVNWVRPGFGSIRYELGEHLPALLLRRNRRYKVYLRFVVSFRAPGPTLPNKRIVSPQHIMDTLLLFVLTYCPGYHHRLGQQRGEEDRQ